MKKMFQTLALFLAFAPSAQANSSAEYGSVHIDPNGYGVQTFKCHGRTFYSDHPMPNIHGCDIDRAYFGPDGKPSNIVTVHYDWEEGNHGGKKPRKVVFYELPDGQMYRLTDTRFLESQLLVEYFEEIVSPIPGSLGKDTNITLDRFGQRNIQHYGGVFCMNYYMSHPFQGKFGWCQGDRLVGGEASYLKGSMTFGEAAIRVQNFVYDRDLKIKGRILGKNTMTAMNTDQKGWVYYAFAVPGFRTQDQENAYIFRVYFNGYIEMIEQSEMPKHTSEL